MTQEQIEEIISRASPRRQQALLCMGELLEGAEQAWLYADRGDWQALAETILTECWWPHTAKMLADMIWEG